MSRRAHLVWLALVLAVPGLPVAAGEKVKLTAYSEYKIDEFLVVDGQRVRVDRRTRYDGVPNFAAIPLGYEAKIKGTRQADGTVLAKRIEIDFNVFTGTEREMKAGFDEIEQIYLQKGRMAIPNERGQIVQDYGPLIEDGPQVARVRRIMANLVPPYINPADVRVYVVDNPEWNAMAAPNYSVWVFRGLLDDMDDDEVALVLGHELAHATHEHSRRQYQRSSWISVGTVAAGVAAGTAIDDDYARSAAQMGTLLGASAVVSGYSRDHEDQADRVGMRYAYEGGYDVSKGPALWQRFADKYGDTNVAVNFFFGEHSRSSKRAALLQTEIRNNHYGVPKSRP